MQTINARDMTAKRQLESSIHTLQAEVDGMLVAAKGSLALGKAALVGCSPWTVLVSVTSAVISETVMSASRTSFTVSLSLVANVVLSISSASKVAWLSAGTKISNSILTLS